MTGMPGGWEWIIILFVVLLLFGSKKLPELARSIGKSISEFKKGKDDAENEEKTVSKSDKKPEGDNNSQQKSA
jgi:sec-independent protein translocase protein TatA